MIRLEISIAISLVVSVHETMVAVSIIGVNILKKYGHHILPQLQTFGGKLQSITIEKFSITTLRLEVYLDGVDFLAIEVEMDWGGWDGEETKG